ncbi:MAG: hypothetical protein QM599_13070 [Pseudoxanthomonas sp.]
MFVALCCILPAVAQASSRNDTYSRTYFAATLASNAWEMLQRVPGFAVVEANEDVRGYASAQGNTLYAKRRLGLHWRARNWSICSAADSATTATSTTIRARRCRWTSAISAGAGRPAPSR